MTTGRNEACPCGSGKKFKKCCMGSTRPEAHATTPPLTPEAQLEMARAAFYKRQFNEAREQLQPLLAKKRVNAATWSLACGIEMQDKKFDRARTYIEKALALEPDNANYLYNYATICAQTGDKDKALKTFRRALAIRPDLYQAVNNMGHVLRDLGRTEEATEYYREVFRHDVRDLGILSQVLLSMQLFSFENHDEMYEMHCDLGRRITARMPESSPQWRPTRANTGEKIRLGYLSPRFSREIVSYFFKPVFDNHDRSRFEIYLYSATPRPDDMTDYFARRADKWTDITRLSDSALCQQIADDKIDILIDLAGHAPENRITATARKPAPVQVSMLDYFDTTGIQAIDYYVTDTFSTPAGGRQKFTEELIYLEQPRLVYEAPDYAPDIQVRDPDAGGIVFGSFNRHEKIIPEVVATWSGLLRETPNSRLLLKNPGFADPAVRDALLQKFSKHGVESHRISFRGRSPHAEMLAEYGDIDIALDTFPYNGGLTTLEALWMGTPVIAIEGQRIISRQSAGILHSLGLPEFVAKSAEEFCDIGKYWAQHRRELNTLRKSLRALMATSPLTDGNAYTRDLECHFERAWNKYLAQQD